MFKTFLFFFFFLRGKKIANVSEALSGDFGGFYRRAIQLNVSFYLLHDKIPDQVVSELETDRFRFVKYKISEVIPNEMSIEPHSLRIPFFLDFLQSGPAL